jgi:WD40 repeat protein
LTDIEWSPDGTMLTSLGEDRLELFDENGVSKGCYEFTGHPTAVDWSDSGDRIAVCYEQPYGLAVLDPNGMKVLAAIACGFVVPTVARRLIGSRLSATRARPLRFLTTAGI